MIPPPHRDYSGSQLLSLRLRLRLPLRLHLRLPVYSNPNFTHIRSRVPRIPESRNLETSKSGFRLPMPGLESDAVRSFSVGVGRL
jgi:hypothetical protein